MAAVEAEAEVDEEDNEEEEIGKEVPTAEESDLS